MTDVLDRPAATGDEDGGGGGDAFAVLGLPYLPALTEEDVRRAYRSRLRAVHPDAGGDEEAAAAVTAAFAALRSGVRRGELLAAAAAAAVMVGRPDPAPRPVRRSAPGRPRSRPAGSPPDPARRAELPARVAAGRAAQGLPPVITDQATLARIADLMVAMEPGAEARKRLGPRPAGAAWAGGDGGPRDISSWRRETRRRWAQNQDQEPAPVSPVGRWWLGRGWARVRYGRPVWLAARIVLAGAVVTVAQVVTAGEPAVPALGVGAVTWVVLTGRLDLAPRSRGMTGREGG
jgi:curved DNA-binding protein CbpA